MKQDINQSVLKILRGIMNELRRSTQSSYWEDMPGLQEQINQLERLLGQEP